MLEFSTATTAELSKRLGLSLDSNNNSSSVLPSENNNKNVKSDKYSLRPRSLRRRLVLSTTTNLIDDEDNEQQPPSSEKNLVQVNNNLNNKSRGRVSNTNNFKPKQKPAPLSKYRRKTANARERSRMREINQAFEALRRAVPQMSIQSHQTNEKLTKITTLRLAMKYIAALSAVLEQNNSNNNCENNLLSSATTNSIQDFLSDCSELDCCFLLESDGESLPLHSSDFSDHSLTPAEFSTSIDFSNDDSLNNTNNDFAPSLSPDDLDMEMDGHLCSHFDPFLSGFS